MCGIAGVFSFNSDEIPSSEKVRWMAEEIAHRGPDGVGFYTSGNGALMLTHRRLSIIDLSNEAAQPMISSNGRYIITFNGEIYNYKELREELLMKGCRFHSDSDTEVLLQLFQLEGASCLDRLDGMFAFAIWDEQEKVLFCARDRFGEKPFYYCRNSGFFVFSSEIKAIKKYLQELSLDKVLLQDYLEGNVVFEGSVTPFKDVEALLPACYLTLSQSEFQINKYWQINLNNKIFLGGDSDYIDRFRELMFESVQLRLRSDVPVGSSLSGGLDSSSVVGVMSKLLNSDFHTFSARFNSEKDEGKWIAEVVESIGVKNHEVWPDQDGLLDEIDKITWHHEFPIGSGSVYAQWCVMSLPSDYSVKVLLDGQGADEYLCGYDELKYFAIWNLYRRGDFVNFFKEKKLFNDYYGSNGNLGYLFLFDPLLKLLGIKRNVFQYGENLKEQLLYYTSTKLGELLRYADRNSMAHSIEVRLPFLSHKLVEFVFSIPDTLIYRNGKTKFILREALQDNLPEAIYNRTDKIGFASPQNAWVNSRSFLKKYPEVLALIHEAGLKPGPEKFRNFAVSSFLKVFDK